MIISNLELPNESNESENLLFFRIKDQTTLQNFFVKVHTYNT